MSSFKTAIKKTNDFFNRRIKLEVVANEEKLKSVNQQLYEQIYRHHSRNGSSPFK